MASIGKLGTYRAPVELDFEYFGEVIRVNPEATDLDVADLMAQFGDVDDETLLSDEDSEAHSEAEKRARAAMMGFGDFLKRQIHPEDRELFWETAKANRQFLKDIMAVSKAITEAVSNFPTGQPSDSSTGPPSTVERSEGALSNRESRRRKGKRGKTVRVVDRRDVATVTAMEALRARGRPDLQAGLLQLRGIEPHPEDYPGLRNSG